MPHVDARPTHAHTVVSTTGPGLHKARTFIGSVDVNAATAKMRLAQIIEEVVTLLASDPQATVSLTLEITAEFRSGVSDTTKRAVSENAASLDFK